MSISATGANVASRNVRRPPTQSDRARLAFRSRMFSRKCCTSWLSAAALHRANRPIPELQLTELLRKKQFVVCTPEQSWGLMSLIWNNPTSAVGLTCSEKKVDLTVLDGSAIYPTVTIPISSVRHSSENLQYATIVAVPHVGIPTMNDVTPPVCL